MQNNGVRLPVKKTRNNLLPITPSKTHSPRAEVVARVGGVDVEGGVALVLVEVEPLVVGVVGQGEVQMAMLPPLRHRLLLFLKLLVSAGFQLRTLGPKLPMVRHQNQ